MHVVLHVDDGRSSVDAEASAGSPTACGAGSRCVSRPGSRASGGRVIAGVLLGEDEALTTASRRFRRSGLYHLLAVSGQNVVLLAGGVLALAVALGIGRRGATLGALAAIGAYVLAVGPQPSVIRAAIAGAAVSVAWLAGRLRDAWHLLLVAACALLAWNPYTLFDAGFQLSFGAVAAIFILGGPFLRVLDGYPLPGWLRSAIAISAACTLVTAPILWLEFGRCRSTAWSRTPWSSLPCRCCSGCRSRRPQLLRSRLRLPLSLLGWTVGLPCTSRPAPVQFRRSPLRRCRAERRQ